MDNILSQCAFVREILNKTESIKYKQESPVIRHRFDSPDWTESLRSNMAVVDTAHCSNRKTRQSFFLLSFLLSFIIPWAQWPLAAALVFYLPINIVFWVSTFLLKHFIVCWKSQRVESLIPSTVNSEKEFDVEIFEVRYGPWCPVWFYIMVVSNKYVIIKFYHNTRDSKFN